MLRKFLDLPVRLAGEPVLISGPSLSPPPPQSRWMWQATTWNFVFVGMIILPLPTALHTCMWCSMTVSTFTGLFFYFCKKWIIKNHTTPQLWFLGAFVCFPIWLIFVNPLLFLYSISIKVMNGNSVLNWVVGSTEVCGVVKHPEMMSQTWMNLRSLTYYGAGSTQTSHPPNVLTLAFT